MDRSLTKNTKNGTERNVDGTIGKRTTENGTISLEALVLERNDLKKSRNMPSPSYPIKIYSKSDKGFIWTEIQTEITTLYKYIFIMILIW